jgi:capsular polysaccharide biosynthesis protein
MNKISDLSILIVAFSILMIGTSAVFNMGFISPALASTDESNNNESNNNESNNDESNTNQPNNEQPTLETVDTHLEECIQQLQNDNTNEALDECQSADDELDRLLVNSTG